jgi:anti-sigma factor RsiW
MNHLSDELLNEYLDNALSNRAPIEDHLAQCADCAARLTMLQTLFAEMESLPDIILSRDLAAPVIHTLRQAQDDGAGSTSIPPRWLTLMIGLQAMFALIVIVIAAPFVIQFASSSMPVLEVPSLTQTFIQLQTQWVTWLEILPQFQLPALPEIPVFEVSSLYFLLAVALTSIFWLVGNGLLLRNQIK